jgi:hypothetical protein
MANGTERPRTIFHEIRPRELIQLGLSNLLQQRLEAHHYRNSADARKEPASKIIGGRAAQC